MKLLKSILPVLVVIALATYGINESKETRCLVEKKPFKVGMAGISAEGTFCPYSYLNNISGK